MYVHGLNAEQRKQLVLMAFHMMMADSVAKDEEKLVVTALKHELGVPALERGDFGQPPRLEAFPDRTSRMTAMLRLAAIAYSDREYHLEETRMLVRYARQFDFHPADLKALDAWGRSYQSVLAEAQRMIAGGTI
ncbi:MAG: hypothetical protein HY985_03985 [Magnetospirillum sp.]|nr:hypothetical protein [Magnetospirillum sp.]